ncbi:MAG: M1 family aminopeptidase, partial [Vicingaceae bacterium]
KARNEFEEPVLIINQDEVVKNESSSSSATRTWQFKAINVRDFAFASSRKFIWDAMAVDVNGKKVMAMSFYPKEGNPLWEQYSTKVVAHTIRTYSKYTIDYPYPVAQSIHSKWIGMEYPMICFNGGRPEEDGTYSERTKYGMLGVIIHEVGHNFFPMIINSDERQWTWMDEGLNTFVQYLTEQEWEPDYPSRRGPADRIVPYMKGDKEKISPIMTNSESIHQFGNNAYGKPATALNILRETVMGRELFDFAFKTYCERWAFKHPTPEDLFRTMEDASAVDLDWFWRGWFYTTDHVDMGISDVKWYQVDTKDPYVEKPLKKEMKASQPKFIGEERNKNQPTYLTKDSTLADFYTFYDPLDITDLDKKEYEKYIERLEDAEKELLTSGHNYYQVDIECIGGLVMPVILEFVFMDGSREEVRIPAEIWKLNHDKVSKVFIFHDEVISITLDPWLETADTDVSNNHWPPRTLPNRFELYKASERGSDRENPMRQFKRMQEKSGEQLQAEPR